MTLKRTPFKASNKPSKCKVCRCEFVRRLPGQKVCGAQCATALAISTREKEARRVAKREAAETKKQLLAFKPLSYFEKITERHCNEYIRARDPDVCISCGVMRSSAWQAGHYISVGANPTLRFNEDNIHKQCVQCNMFEGSNAIEYRKGLIAKIGIERVEKLEAWYPPIKVTREYLQELAEYYKTKLKALKAKSPLHEQ